MKSRRDSIASTFHPTHEVTQIRADGRREIVPVMLVDINAYTLEEWMNDADWPAAWQRSEFGWRWKGKEAPAGFVRAEFHRLGRGKDPRGPSKADRRVTINARDDQLERWQSAAEQTKQPLSTWAAGVLDVAVAKVKR